MKTWEIWSEGFRATGEQGVATRLGTAQGETFVDACDALAKSDPAFAAYYSRDRRTHWGCRLFDNEADARKSFG